MGLTLLWVDPPQNHERVVSHLATAGLAVVCAVADATAVRDAIRQHQPRAVLISAAARLRLAPVLAESVPALLVCAIIPVEASAELLRDAIAHADTCVPEPLAPEQLVTRLQSLRLQSAEAQRLSENRFELAFQGSPDAINLNRVTDGLYVDVNPGFLALTGYTRSEVVGRSSLELNIWATPQHRAAFVERLMRDHKVDNLEADFRMKDGSMRRGLLSARIIVLHGEPHAITVTRDINEKMQAELALQASERRFRRITENMTDLVAELDGLGRFRYVSPSYQATLGFTPDALVGTLAFDRVHPDDLDTVRGEYARGLATGRSTGLEFRYQHADGRWLWFQTSGQVVTDAQGRPDGVVIASRDITEQRRAQQAARQVEERLALALEASQTGTFSIDPATSMATRTRIHARIFGYDAVDGDWTVEQFLAHVDPDDRDWVRRTVQARIAERSGWQFECRIRRRDGERRWVLIHSHCLQTSDSVRFFGTIRDITQRKQVEEARRQNEALLQTVFDYSPVGKMVFDKAGVLRRTNPRIAEIFGTDLSLFVGTSSLLNDPRFQPDELAQLARGQVVQREVAYDFDAVPFPTTRTGTADLNIITVPVPHEASADIGYIVQVQDVTDLRRAERLRHAILDNIPDPAWMKDLEGRYLAVNDSWCRFTGIDREQALNTVDAVFFPPDVIREIRLAEGELVTREQSLAREETLVGADGRSHTFETLWAVVKDGSGRPYATVGVARDISERKRLEAGLRQVQKLEAIGQLAGGVAHDFNNILAAIMMQAGLLQSNRTLNADGRHMIDELSATASRGATLIRQLLLFSRRAAAVMQPLRINDLVADLLKMLHRVVRENVSLHFAAGTRVPTVVADPGMLEQVLTNLVINARDAMPTGGGITIATSAVTLTEADCEANAERRPGSFVCLAVADDGCGMDAETLKRIFEPFFTTKPVGQGTGLGLATVYGIVGQHRGWVEVDSAVGRGTTFRVYLPAAGAEVSSANTGQTRHAAIGGHEGILVVEDNAAVRRLLGQLLHHLGYRVVEATSGDEALRLWPSVSQDIDLVITDMVMPGSVDGRALAAGLRRQKPGLKVMISSGYSADMAELVAGHEPGISFLPKPYQMGTLAQAIRRCLGGSERPH